MCVRVEQALIYGLIWTGTGDWEWAALMACYTKSSIMLCCVVLVCVGYWESRNEQPGPGRDGVRARASELSGMEWWTRASARCRGGLLDMGGKTKAVTPPLHQAHPSLQGSAKYSPCSRDFSGFAQT